MRKRSVWGIVLFAGLLVGTASGQSLNDQLFTAVQSIVFKRDEANHKATAEALIAKGADVNAKNKNYMDWTPLHAAVQSDSKDIAELLISKGADVNARDLYGRTPLFEWADDGSDNEVAELLISKGADVNTSDDVGDTPLHIAVGKSRKGPVELLIAKGADVSIKNKRGETPLQVPAFNGACLLLPSYKNDPGCVITRQQIVALLQDHMGRGNNPQQLLNNLLEQFKGHSGDDSVRHSIIDLALKQHLAIPAEAEAAAGRGTYIFKNAKSPDEVLNAAKEYLAAIEAAPWVADYYFNLCTVLEKTPYSQQALHACKLYLVAAPDATDAGAVRQRIAGLQYAADRDKTQMKQRTRYIKPAGVEDLYRFGGITSKVSDKDIVLKLFVDWGAAPPKYQIYAGCFVGNDVYGDPHDLVSSDSWIKFCKPGVQMHLIIKPEGEGFVEVSDSNGGSIRATLDELFKAKQKTMAEAIMLSADSDGTRFYVPYLQGGGDLKHAGFAMYETDCNGNILKKDPRALPDDFVPGDVTGFGRFTPELDMWPARPKTDVCTSEFASKTGYHFGEAE